jgi:hypothetical protein
LDKQAWAEESKRRKSYWRRIIRSDESYGRIWSILPSVRCVSSLPSALPLPHDHHAPIRSNRAVSFPSSPDLHSSSGSSVPR